jgi:hypothetical protein
MEFARLPRSLVGLHSRLIAGPVSEGELWISLYREWWCSYILPQPFHTALRVPRSSVEAIGLTVSFGLPRTSQCKTLKELEMDFHVNAYTCTLRQLLQLRSESKDHFRRLSRMIPPRLFDQCNLPSHMSHSITPSPSNDTTGPSRYQSLILRTCISSIYHHAERAFRLQLAQITD